jgi:hypothetical protein
MKLEPYFTPYLKIISKWIKHIDIRPENLNVLEENIWEIFHDIILGKDVFNTTSNSQATKNKQMVLIQTK